MANEPTETAAPEAAVPDSPSAASGTAPSDSASASAEAAEPTLESITAERDAARQQAQEYLALAQRAQADFLNYRRRAEQERAEAFDRLRATALSPGASAELIADAAKDLA